jgi:hypothetical protein
LGRPWDIARTQEFHRVLECKSLGGWLCAFFTGHYSPPFRMLLY